MKEPIGMNKSKWEGGLIKARGYVYLYSPNHPFRNHWGKGYVKRGRILLEKHLGRYLERNEFVHHKNGIRDDDRLENLEITDLSKHQKIHQKTTVLSMKRDNLGRFLCQ